MPFILVVGSAPSAALGTSKRPPRLEPLEDRITPSFSPAAGSPFTVGTNTNPVSVAIADVNGDGIPDLVTADKGTNQVSVLLGAGGGTGWFAHVLQRPVPAPLFRGSRGR